MPPNLNAIMISPRVKNILRGYLGFHFALLFTLACGPGILYAFPLSFLLYGGIQAVILWRFLKRKDEVSLFARWSLYFFTLMELMYTVALFLFEANLRHGLSLDCLRSFNDPEFSGFYYAKYPNLFYAFAILIWGIAYLIRTGIACMKKKNQ